MIEQDASNSVIIAATNHPEILDHALIRRFDDVVEYHLPSPRQAVDLLQTRLGPFMPTPFRKAGITPLLDGLSFAEICRASDEAIKDAIMNDQDRVELSLLKKALEERHAISKRLTRKGTGTANNDGIEK